MRRFMIMAFFVPAGCSLIVGSGPRQRDADADGDDGIETDDAETTMDDDEGDGGEEIAPAVCGDGILATNEACDDGDNVDDLSCSADCSSTPVFQVNTLYASSQWEPSISGADGLYVIAWTSGGSTEAGDTSQHVRARLLDDEGQGEGIGPFEGDIRLNTTTTGVQYRPSVAMGLRSFMTVWIDNSPDTGAPPGDVMWRLIPIDTGTSPPEQTLNVNSREGTQNWGRVAGCGSFFFAAWITSDVMPRHAQCSLFDVSSSSWLAEEPCLVAPTDDELEVDVSMSRTGTHAAAWVSGGKDIVMQLFSPSGDRMGAGELVSTPASGACDFPSVAFDGSGRILVVWRYLPQTGDIQIQGRMFSAGGEPLPGGEFVINTTALTESATTMGSNPNYVPDAAGDPEEDIFIVVWDAPGQGGGRGRIVLAPGAFGVNRIDREAFGQDFTSTEDFAVIPAEYNRADVFVVACAHPGSCMVVWSDESLVDDTEASGIRGRLITIAQP